jgi:hypothetical protein
MSSCVAQLKQSFNPASTVIALEVALLAGARCAAVWEFVVCADVEGPSPEAPALRSLLEPQKLFKRTRPDVSLAPWYAWSST